MTFSEKLNLLMNITNTINSSLAHTIALDPSFISRLRQGVRTPSKNQNYVKSISSYFARNCNLDYQKVALCQALKIPPNSLPTNNEKKTEIINKWLIEDNIQDINPIKNLLQDVSDFSFKRSTQNTAYDVSCIPESTLTNGQVLYGIEGKQNAVITFLLKVLNSKSPQTLLLYSNEDLEWLTINHEFAAKWTTLLSKVIMNGNKIKIIHTVSRNIDDMSSSIKQWLPIYMTGSIEPYYYPKTRDGIFRRTLFIASETVALASASVGNSASTAANFLYTDKNTIKALAKEYNSYLSLCRPLMRIFTSINKDNYLATLSEFESEDGHSIIKTNELSSISMPMCVVESILSCTDNDTKKRLLSYHKKRTDNFLNNLKNHKFTQMITLPDIETIKRGDVNVCFSDLLSGNQLFYNQTQFIAHLQNIIRLMKTFDNYNTTIASSSKSDEYMLYTKEGVGIIVAKTSLPSVVFAINESNMVESFWNYMSIALNKTTMDKSQKKHTIEKLEKFIGILL
ncbi:transcriptional regulator [Clostridium sp.]|uniref:transcriptional regulator n=1 Tax=Clostridium sp. TaxID=1506 RepID=UPI003D6CE0D9